ncbi:unnamed protein product [Amaranthus hypochondriacus]
MKMNLKDFQKCNHQTSRISHDILQQQQQGDHDILILFQTYILLLNMLLEIPNYSLRELSLLVFRTPNFTEEIHQENAEAEAMINQRMDGSEPSRADGHEGYDTSYEHARGADRSAIRRTARGSICCRTKKIVF